MSICWRTSLVDALSHFHLCHAFHLFPPNPRCPRDTVHGVRLYDDVEDRRNVILFRLILSHEYMYACIIVGSKYAIYYPPSFRSGSRHYPLRDVH